MGTHYATHLFKEILQASFHSTWELQLNNSFAASTVVNRWRIGWKIEEKEQFQICSIYCIIWLNILNFDIKYITLM